ncbi:MAG TPA: DUF4129 domain-containing protein [Candidatus Hydrogenedentes bacterium]|nr:DUF4129 domain-containing protein [Candidatus Hydrogenedentota bacterium]HNT86330.1 DUF4129 domain-containing protein [Candidatus Hydrogenedentota bacterium]
MSCPPQRSDDEPPARTDFASLVAAPVTAQRRKRAATRTDFASLGGAGARGPRPVGRTVTDLLIDGLTPLMILIMVYSVIFFLLDVRYVYTAVHDSNLRVVAFFFVLGVVALNRLIARDGSNESILYIVTLAGSVGMYTLATTSMFGVGSVSRNFMNDNPWLASGFNMVLVALIWWLVNRLTHECCVDENLTAGDIGILRGTALRVQRAMRREPLPATKDRRWGYDTAEEAATGPLYGIEPFDPSTDHTVEKPKLPPAPIAPVKRLPKRHPGISILLVSVPVLFIFAIGLPVVRHGGERWVRAGMFYMGVYCAAALMLLMLTSLGGLRAYFQTRNIRIPAGIGPFWVGLGVVMIVLVLAGALQMPLPELPPVAHVDSHQTDPWARDQVTLRLVDPATLPDALVTRTARFVDRLGEGVLALFGVFLAYGALRGIGGLAARIARRRDRYPRFVRRFFDAVDRLIQFLLRVPRLPGGARRVRISRNIATCVKYRNLMGDPVASARMGVADHVAYAYEALCALAYDLGAPRKEGQTPFEFINALPEALRTLREEARELTQLYVVTAYSPETLDPRVTDRLRKFWTTYNRVRNRVLR